MVTKYFIRIFRFRIRLDGKRSPIQIQRNSKYRAGLDSKIRILYTTALNTHNQHWSIDWNRAAAMMLRSVAAVVIIILSFPWWSWTRLCCVWKLSNLFWRPVSALKNISAWKCTIIRITGCEKRKFYPVLAKIRINRIRINRGLLYFQSFELMYAILNYFLNSNYSKKTFSLEVRRI